MICFSRNAFSPGRPGDAWRGAKASLVGRKVVGEGFRSCQVCDRCHAGETTLCGAGYEETGFTQPGAMAATLTLPARLLHPLPDDCDLTAAALLEPAACIAAAAIKANARPGERVAVVGTGTLGMFAVQFLRAGSPGELLVVGALLGQMKLVKPLAAKAAALFGLSPAEERMLNEVPHRGTPMPPTDPLIYRFYELVMVNGPAWKALIEEEFGDGIMSAIDFHMTIERQPAPKGDRVKVGMTGKFLPFKYYGATGNAQAYGYKEE